MAQTSFAAQVSDWVKETKERREAVYRGSAKRIVSVMQTPRGEGGNLRVDTGFLRASLVATVGDGMPSIRVRPDGDATYTYNPVTIDLVIDSATINDPISALYTAAYARHREFGARGQPGDRWVGLAAQRWPQVVDQECEAVKARAGG